MKIACITTVRIPAATANSVQVMKACAALKQNGHDVHLWIPEQAKHPAPEQPSPANLQRFYGLRASFPVGHLPAQARLKRYDFCWRAVQAARRSGAGVVYTWAIQAAVFALLFRLPVVLEMHGPPEGGLGPLLFRLFLALPGKKRILPISKALLGLLGLPSSSATSIAVSPNGVELERFASLPSPMEARRQLGLPERPTVGYTGHFYAGRGMQLMLALAHRLPDVQFLWVGGKPQDVNNWQARLETEGVRNVILAGFIENERLPHYQAAAEILLMPYERIITGSGGGNSAAYCSPMKMFEYMACGRAIVSSDLPVLGEVLNDANAVRCPPEDSEAWGMAIGDLLADPARRESLAQQAWHDVQAYTWSARARRAMEGFL